MESICRLCFQPAALFQVPGYNLPTCVKCSEHLTTNGIPANFYQTIRQDLVSQPNSVVVSTGGTNLIQQQQNNSQQQQQQQQQQSQQQQQTQQQQSSTSSSSNRQQQEQQNHNETTSQQQQQATTIINQALNSVANQNGKKSSNANMQFDLEKTMQHLDYFISQVDLLFNEEGSCPLCSKTFSRKSSLLTHIRNHSAERKYVCTYCQKGFTQAANLRNHERIHTNDRPYVCVDCGKTFTQITNLNNHRRLHTGERPFVCIEPECGRSFAQVTNLNNHMKTHHKVQQYCCNQCPKKFTQVTSLNQHLQAHAGITGYYCPRCPEKTFKQQSQLHTHMKSHGYITCPVANCNQSFAVKQHLTKHLLTRHSHNELPPPKRSKKTLQNLVVQSGVQQHQSQQQALQGVVGHQIQTTMVTTGQRGRPPKKKQPQQQNAVNNIIIQQDVKLPNVTAASLQINHLQQQQQQAALVAAVQQQQQQQQQQQNGELTGGHIKTSNSENTTNNHQVDANNEDLKCNDCGLMFQTENELREHIFYKHPERRFMQAILEENRYLMRIQNQQNFVCNLCCHVFKSHLALVRHTAKFHGQLL
ncbi:zinc finger protein 184 isoform X3 [Condylostylus longicornis]|uniref:zinc finger protein 184 isoform X3 n=1 Tax=Condylostylus longicornis TaxID=2530218 RepID=UPI00244DCB2E|nr:zinc finger protein 184 isoform X3 [Condylostylus longicornis]